MSVQLYYFFFMSVVTSIILILKIKKKKKIVSKVYQRNHIKSKTPTAFEEKKKKTPTIFSQNFSVSQLKTSISDSSDHRSASLTSITAADRFTNYTPTLWLLHVSIIITQESNRLRYVRRSPFSNLISLSAMCCDIVSAFFFLIFTKPLSFLFL